MTNSARLRHSEARRAAAARRRPVHYVPALTHDADKLIRQLSLVAYLMAEQRPVTARDVKLRVEGYANMGDEAFARRFYADRSELQGLGVPIASVRDEFTSEELYSLREEHYFLPSVELTDSELAALQTSFYLLEGQFAYAEPLRLALQNLALGRAWPAADPGPKTATVELLGPSYTSEVAQRLAKLEQAISRQRTVRFRYWTIAHRLRGRAHREPVRPVRAERGLVRGRRRPRPRRGPRPPAHVPRVADPRRDQVRHPPRARLPHAGRLQRHRLPRPRAVAAGRPRRPARPP